MNNVTIYEVTTKGNVRLTTLKLDEAVKHGQDIFKREKIYADINEGSYVPTDHTTKAARRERAERDKQRVNTLKVLEDEANRIRALSIFQHPRRTSYSKVACG